MIKLKIRTIWQGKVGIHEKYLSQAKEEKQGLMFVKGNDIMELPYGSICKKIVCRSDNPFTDRYNNSTYYLYYFDWKPDNLKQAELFKN